MNLNSKNLSTEYLLQVINLEINYGMVEAVKNISLYIEKGEIISLIGPNGAGKSTTLKAIGGILEVTGGQIISGDVLYKGESIKRFRTDELVRKGISLVPEGRRVFPTLTVNENLEMGAYIRNDKKSILDDIEKVYEIFPLLKERKNQKAGTLSGGEQQMLALGRSLMLEPELILLDEPSLGLSPNYVETIFEKLIEINKQGTSILLVEQNARMALEICHRGYVFDVGIIALEGTKDFLIEDEKVKVVYLGG
jgi:branched-chain amino acid transport system ATP-binding protein